MMNEVIEVISKPWPWYVAGLIIAVVMSSLLYLGNNFGISSNLRTVCAIIGGGKKCEFFDFNWKNQTWNLIFAIGMVGGGIIANIWLTPDTAVHLSEQTIAELKGYGFSNPGESIVPTEIFSWDFLFSVNGVIVLIIGGFLIGFGTRYAGGCTSGHAISGLSDLQLPSLIAVVGFFIGGLIMTYFILPHVFTF